MARRSFTSSSLTIADQVLRIDQKRERPCNAFVVEPAKMHAPSIGKPVAMPMDRYITGPIGAILTPQLAMMERGQSLPYASSLCGACYEVCPVKINIPEILIHLRGRVVSGRSETSWCFPPGSNHHACDAVDFFQLHSLQRGTATWPHRTAPLDSTERLDRATPECTCWLDTYSDLGNSRHKGFREWFQTRSHASPVSPKSPEATHD